MCKSACVKKCVKAFVCKTFLGKSVCVSKRLCVKASVLHLHIYIFSTFSFHSSLSSYYPVSFIQPCSCNFYLLAVILHQYMFQCLPSAFTLISLYPAIIVFLLLASHTSYIFITLHFCLHLSNLLLYALGSSVRKKTFAKNGILKDLRRLSPSGHSFKATW